jgi:hypothetical protein
MKSHVTQEYGDAIDLAIHPSTDEACQDMVHVFQCVVFSKTSYSRVTVDGISAFQSYEKHTPKKLDFTCPF